MQEFSISLLHMHTNTPVTTSDEVSVPNHTYTLL